MSRPLDRFHLLCLSLHTGRFLIKIVTIKMAACAAHCPEWPVAKGGGSLGSPHRGDPACLRLASPGAGPAPV